MSQSGGGDPEKLRARRRETASRIAEEIAPLLREARDAKFEFLAYLLGMALKEARGLSEDEREG